MNSAFAVHIRAQRRWAGAFIGLSAEASLYSCVTSSSSSSSSSSYAYHLFSNLHHLICLSPFGHCVIACHLPFFRFPNTRNLHSIHRLDPFLDGIISVRLVCQRRKIEKHRLKNTISDEMHGCSSGFLRKGSAMVVGHAIPQSI